MIAPRTSALNDEKRLRLELGEARATVECEIAARRRLERVAVAAIDRERQRLAQILHDSVCQSLNGIGLFSRVILRKLETGRPVAVTELGELSGVIDSAIREVHAVVLRLRLAEAGGGDLLPALARLAESISNKVPCDFECPESVVVDRPVAAQFVEIAQQAATDALSRPGATRIGITLSAEGPLLTLTVRDDGQAVAEESTQECLASRELMLLRAGAIGATLAISSTANQGTTITCTLSQPS